MSLYGVLDVNVWQAILATLAMTHFTIAAVTIYMHRAQAHRALTLNPFVAHVINGVGHAWGYRSFESADASTNIVPWGILVGGEELHNNHHADPSSARRSSKWWELDLGWLHIRALSALRLARIKKVAPELPVVPGKPLVDMETLRAVVVSRMHVYARYTKDVLKPVTREELCRDTDHCRSLVRRTQRRLAREGGRLDAAARSRLEQILGQSDTLATV